MTTIFNGAAKAAFFALLTMMAAGTAGAATLSGSWTGSGYVQPENGPREAVRCRVTFNQESAKVYGVSATCASKSNSVRQTGEVLMVRPDRYVGDFFSPQFNVGGRIAITLRGSTQTVTFNGSGVTGRLTLRKR